MAKVLVIGVDSGLGTAIAEALAMRGNEVIGTTRRPQLTGHIARLRLDLADPDIGRLSLPAVDAAIICAAMSRFVDCREQPDLARRVNVIAPALLGRRLTDAGSRVVLLSTSAVFDGKIPYVKADHPTAPISAYGALKAEAESAILGCGKDASVLRMTKVITPQMPLIRGWIDALRQRTSVEAFSDMTLAPLSLDDVANGVVGVLDDREGGGIYHLSGQSDISYFQVAGHLASRLGVPSSFVHSARAADRIPPSELMHYTTLDVGRISKLTGWAAPEPLALINQVFGPVLAAKPATR